MNLIVLSTKMKDKSINYLYKKSKETYTIDKRMAIWSPHSCFVFSLRLLSGCTGFWQHYTANCLQSGGLAMKTHWSNIVSSGIRQIRETNIPDSRKALPRLKYVRQQGTHRLHSTILRVRKRILSTYINFLHITKKITISKEKKYVRSHFPILHAIHRLYAHLQTHLSLCLSQRDYHSMQIWGGRGEAAA